MEVVPSQAPDFSWPDGFKRPNVSMLHKKQCKSQQTNVLHLWRSGDFSDATLVVDDVSFPVHRNILACTSDYFRALFTDSLNSSHGQATNPQTTDNNNKTTCASSSEIQNRSRSTHLKGIRFTTSHSSNSSSIPVADHEHMSPAVLYKSSTYQSRKSSRLTKPSNSDTSRKEQVPNLNINKPGPRFKVTLCDVSADVIYQILEHAYGGRVTLTQDNVQQILTAADRFQVTSLAEECSNFLSQKLSVHNCISLIQLSANFFDCASLKQAASQFLLDHFEIVYKTSPEFIHLTAEELNRFLDDDRLNISQEENILDVVVKWVTGDRKNRQVHIPYLVQCIRVGAFLPGLPLDNIILASHSDPDVNTACFEAVAAEVVKAVADRQQHMMTNADYSMFAPRLPRDVMFVIGGSNFGYPLGIVEAFDSRTWNWLNIGAYDFAPRSYHGVAHIDKHIYIVGGFDGQSYLSSCCRFCPDTFIMSWESVTPMHTKRCYVGVTQFQGAIYAMGGYDGVYRLNSAERFDPGTNQWSFISPMTHHRSDAGVAVLDDKIYVCGGFSGSECIRTVEMYDPQQEEWVPQTSMPHGRSGLGFVSHGGRLYAVGGFNGIDSSVRLSSMESYNPATKQWTTLSPMPHPRSNMAVAVMEGILYSIGGYNGERTSAMVECYDFEHDSWHQATRLSQSRSALSVCVLSGLSNISSLLGRDGLGGIEDKYDDNDDDDGVEDVDDDDDDGDHNYDGGIGNTFDDENEMMYGML